MKNIFIKYTACAALVISAIFYSRSVFGADFLKAGDTFPAFKITSGAGEVLTEADIKGKVAVLFYEWKSAVEDNRPLKNALNEFYAGQPEVLKKDIGKIAVVNCDGVIFTGIWKSALRSVSVKEGLTIYGDWDGKMGEALGVKPNTSSVFILDKDGIVRYAASGKLDDSAITAVKSLLMSFENPEQKLGVKK